MAQRPVRLLAESRVLSGKNRKISVKTHRHDEQVCDIDDKHKNALPAVESLCYDCGNCGNERNKNGNGEVEIYVLCRNREFAAVYEGTDRKNQCRVDDVCTDNIADGHRGLFFNHGGYRSGKFGERRADSHDCNADDSLRNTPRRGNVAAVVDEEL